MKSSSVALATTTHFLSAIMRLRRKHKMRGIILSMSHFVLPVTIIVAGMILLRSNTETPDAYGAARRVAIAYLRTLSSKHTVVFDFDDTLFRPRTVVDITYAGRRDFWYSDRHAVHIYAPIREIIDILQVATTLGHRVVIITARPDTQHTRTVVEENCKRRGLTVHALYMAPPRSDPSFKARIRRRIHADCPVALTVGDQWPDVSSPGEAHWIKLPDRRDRGLHMSLA